VRIVVSWVSTPPPDVIRLAVPLGFLITNTATAPSIISVKMSPRFIYFLRPSTSPIRKRITTVAITVFQLIPERSDMLVISYFFITSFHTMIAAITIAIVTPIVGR
jgi:hypothetical protein